MQPIIVTAAIIESAGRILISRRLATASSPLQWEFPGGKLEPDEDPVECVVREVREELGIEVGVRAVYDVVYHRYPQGPVLLLVYRCQWLNGTVQNLQVAEHAWVEPQRLSEFDFLPADLPLVRRLSAEGTTLP